MLAKFIFALILLCGSVSSATAEECGGLGDAFVLQSQHQADNFNNVYGDCTNFYWLDIDSGEDIENLDGRSGKMEGHSESEDYVSA